MSSISQAVPRPIHSLIQSATTTNFLSACTGFLPPTDGDGLVGSSLLCRRSDFLTRRIHSGGILSVKVESGEARRFQGRLETACQPEGPRASRPEKRPL